MNRVKLNLLFLILTSAYFGVVAQSNAQNLPPVKSPQKLSLGVAGANERPDLVEPFNNNLRFRISLRPRAYRGGDILNIVATIRNYGEKPFFLEKNLETVFSLVNEKGTKIKIIEDYIDIFHIPTKNSYMTLIPTEELTVRYNLLLGCEERTAYFEKLRQDKITDREIFEQDRYAYYGQGCIDFDNQTNIYLQAEVSNELVVTDQADDIKRLEFLSEHMISPYQLRVNIIKTAVGKIQSNVMKISISSL